jgi:CRP/FNR family cyclic AMP-dependent transcriptional regulator
VSSSVLFVDADDAETAGFLARLYDDEVTTVLSYAQARRYANGDMAIRHGELDRSLFVITAGRFEVLVPTPSGPQRARLLQPGDIFGDLAFFDGKPRSADVRAVEDSEALIMTPAAFDRLRLTHPRLALCFALDLGRILSVRFRECSRRLAAIDQV